MNSEMAGIEDVEQLYISWLLNPTNTNFEKLKTLVMDLLPNEKASKIFQKTTNIRRGRIDVIVAFHFRSEWQRG